MRKFMIAMVLLALVAAPALVGTAPADKPAAAAILSSVMPGVGEWYNNNWQGGFPWGECIVGHICFLFRFTSVMDAAAGKPEAAMRINFWGAPE